jgi:hypothetical protein
LLGSGTLSGASVESKEASETDQQLNEALLRNSCSAMEGLLLICKLLKNFKL